MLGWYVPGKHDIAEKFRSVKIYKLIVFVLLLVILQNNNRIIDVSDYKSVLYYGLRGEASG